jgi:hypothetical protein
MRTAHRECVKQEQTALFERGLNCDQLFRSASRGLKNVRTDKNAVGVLSRHTSRKRDVFALNDKLSMHEKFHRHQFAPKLNRKARGFNPL